MIEPSLARISREIVHIFQFIISSETERESLRLVRTYPKRLKVDKARANAGASAAGEMNEGNNADYDRAMMRGELEDFLKPNDLDL